MPTPQQLRHVGELRDAFEESENVRADLRCLVRRTLARHGYPPDKQEQATRTVLEQGGALSAEWVAA